MDKNNTIKENSSQEGYLALFYKDISVGFENFQNTLSHIPYFCVA